MQTDRAPPASTRSPTSSSAPCATSSPRRSTACSSTTRTTTTRTADLVGQISKRSRGKIALYKDSIPIFERFNIERQIEQTFQRKVALPSGGEIVIDETEALIAIDVNTGSHKNRSGDEKNTIYAVNLEAATRSPARSASAISAA
jgi:ribonuclease G